MRVLIAHDYGCLIGGAEHMCVTLRTGLRARGHEVRLFGSTANPLGQPVIADDTCYGSTTRTRKFLQIANPSARRQLSRVIDAFRPDVVHVRMFLTQLSPIILPLVRDLPSLLHVVNYDLICPINTKTLPDGTPCHYRPGLVCRRTGCMSLDGVARAFVQRKMIDLSVFDKIVTNSHWVRKRLQAEDVRVDGVIYNGVPETPARPPLSDPPSVSFAGRLVDKKGVDMLLRAFALVLRRQPDARLRLAGDGPARAGLEHLTRELGIDGSVDFLGYLPRAEMEAQLARAWLQAVPGRWEEPFGLVAAEAMMRGTAVVAADTGGPSEQVADGETGLLVPPGDLPGLADAVLRILADRDLAERMGAAGRVRALELFTETRAVDNVEAAYRDILAGRNLRPVADAAVKSAAVELQG